VKKCSLFSRWMFNLTVSIENWYIKAAVEMRAFLVCLRNLVGIIGIFGLGPFISFNLKAPD